MRYDFGKNEAIISPFLSSFSLTHTHKHTAITNA